jgi:integrase
LYACLKHFRAFVDGHPVKFKDLNESLFLDFRDFLLESNLSQNSAVSYFAKLRHCLKQAYKDGILREDLGARIEPIKEVKTRKAYLSQAELNTLAITPCRDEQLRRAGLFSALTGLRFSDIEKLTWSELQHITGQGYSLNFTQRKTGSYEDLPISDQAAEFLGDRGAPEDHVFNNLRKIVYHTTFLQDWLKEAGITKKASFHSFRHTFAVLQLQARPDGTPGTDIYTVSKMLGHKSLKNTQIYAQIVDESKRKAANRIQIKYNGTRNNF